MKIHPVIQFAIPSFVNLGFSCFLLPYIGREATLVAYAPGNFIDAEPNVKFIFSVLLSALVQIAGLIIVIRLPSGSEKLCYASASAASLVSFSFQSKGKSSAQGMKLVCDTSLFQG